LNESFSLIPNAAALMLAVTEIISCNQITAQYGLILKESDARELASTRREALEKVGRIEFSGGVISRLITEFCDSPYLNQSNYAETLNELVEAFYYFKNETLDELDDDELIALMKKSFDQSCRGSVDLLQTRDLEMLARRIRYGVSDLEELSRNLGNGLEDDSEGVNLEQEWDSVWDYFWDYEGGDY